MRVPLRSDAAQATVEFVALLPVLAVVALLGWQAAVAGEAMWSVAGAARAAARAAAVGADARAAAARVLPGRLRARLRVRAAAGGAVEVAVGVPAVMGAGDLATVRARARFAPQSP